MVDKSEKICYEILEILKDCQIEILEKLKKEKKEYVTSSKVQSLPPGGSFKLPEKINVDSLIEMIKGIEWDDIPDYAKNEICSASLYYYRKDILNKFVLKSSIRLLSDPSVSYALDFLSLAEIKNRNENINKIIEKIKLKYKQQLEDILKKNLNKPFLK